MAPQRGLTLRTLRPGTGLDLRFIVLGPCEEAFAARGALQVADETASAALLPQKWGAGSWGPEGVVPAPGEIFWLLGGEAFLDKAGRLLLTVGRGKLQRAGYLALAFSLEPFLSLEPWQEPAPAVAAPQAPPPREESGGRACFLCGEPGHAVFQCGRRDQGVAVSCGPLESSPPEQRQVLLQEGLRAASLPEAERLHWYKKEGKEGMFFLCFKSKDAASRVLEAGQLQVRGSQLAAYPITAPNSGKRQAGGAASSPVRTPPAPDPRGLGWKNRGVAAAAQGSAAACVGSNPQEAEAPSVASTLPVEEAPAEATPALAGSAGCYLCGSQQHAFANCPLAKSSVCVAGASEEEAFDLRHLLSRYGATVLSTRWHGGKAYVQLQDTKQARRVCAKACEGAVVLKGRRLSVFPCYRAPDPAAETGGGVPAVAASQGSKRPADTADSSQPPKKKSKGGQERGSGGDHGRKQCFLCGDTGHELPACPVRQNCVLVCREWGATPGKGVPQWPQGLRHSLGKVLSHAGFHVQREHYHKGVCYVQLAGAEEVRQLLASTDAGGMTVAGEVLRVRAARSTRNQQGQANEAEKPEEEAPQSGCALCGTEDHTLASCELAKRSARIRCEAFREKLPEETGAVDVIREACGVAPESVRSSAGVLYVTLPSREILDKLVEVAAGEGLEICDEMVSVESLAQSASTPAAPAQGGLAGLRPRARRR